MKKQFIYFLLLITFSIRAQVDYSDKWEDFFSYNNVKDFVITNNMIYAIVDNAVFTYDIQNESTQKLSSINGLSGENTSTIFYSEAYQKIIIGYQTGLVEVIDQHNKVKVFNDVVRLNVAGSKRINHFNAYQNKIYVSTDFALVEFDIENDEFGDTFFIGNGSTQVKINQSTVFNDRIFAATENGIYSADVNNLNLIDFNNWTQPSGGFVGNFSTIQQLNNRLFAVSENTFNELILPNNKNTLINFSTPIVNSKITDNYLTISTNNYVNLYGENIDFLGQITNNLEYNFNVNQSLIYQENIYIATKKYGILKTDFNNISFTEIHPKGPLNNDAYDIEVANNHLWVVSGGTTYSSYNALNIKKGYSHFNGEDWINQPYDNTEMNYRDLVDITIDPNDVNHVFISSYKDGLLEIQDDVIVNYLDETNSGLELRVPYLDWLIVSSTAFDSQGNLWAANGWTPSRIKKWNSNGSWEGIDIENIITQGNEKYGLGDIAVDKLNNVWIPSRDNGLMVVSSNGQQKRAFINEENNGNLPNKMVKAVVADKNNRIWIGTLTGLVTFSGVGSVFESENINANSVLIRLEGATGDEQAELLLGEQPINTIAVDGANNKWFGTNSSGVLNTNPSGQETLNLFNTTNSPLPSDEILRIKVDQSNGKVYFATAKGIVAYNDNVAPFGEVLGETYAYPNPSTKENEFITIDGRNGTHLPKNTNVKILDSAGYLVHETNVVEGQEVKGGKVIWNKRNLSGRKVASGIYIILLTIPDATETSVTKVAIIN